MGGTSGIRSTEAVAIAKRIGFPVVAKGVSAALPHKSDAGVVMLGLDTAKAVRAAYAQIVAVLAQHGGGSVLIAEQVTDGVELVLGANLDPEVEPVILFGTGGIALNANINGSTIDLNTTGGGVTQAITTSITAAALQSSFGVTGNVSLLGENLITEVNNFTVTPSGGPGTGNFQFVDEAGLFVEGNISTPSGNVFIQGGGPFGIIIDDGSITTGATGMVSLQTDTFENASTISTGNCFIKSWWMTSDPGRLVRQVKQFAS